MLAKKKGGAAPPVKKIMRKSTPAPTPPAKPAGKQLVKKKPPEVEWQRFADKPPEAKNVPPPKNVKGIRDERFPEYLLVPIEKAPAHPLFKPMHKTMRLPNTFYKWAGDRAVAMVTKMADGLWVAWDTCGACHFHYVQCQCQNGVQVTRGVEYIYDKTNADLAGEDWTINHPHYLGSLSKAQRDAREAAGPRKPVWVGAGATGITQAGRTASSRAKWGDDPIPLPRIGDRAAADGKKRLQKATAKPAPEAPRKKLLTKASGKSSDEILKGGSMDMGALDKEAADDVQDMTSQIMKRLKSSPAKATTTKKIIRKR